MDMDEVAVPYSARAAQQRPIAAEALPFFGLADASYQLIKLGTTTTFRVVPCTGQPCVLRLQRLSRMPLSVVQSEVRWLTDLRHHTPLLVPAPIPASNGELAVLLPALPDREPQIATLFAWLPGRQKRLLTLRDAELIGESLAILHRFSSTYRPLVTFGRWDFDCATFLENATVLDHVGATLLPPATVQLMHHAIRFVQSILTVLESESASYGLIHADTNLTNWLFQSDQVALLDFEVCCYGYYLFDVGRLLHELAQNQKYGPALTIAFYRAYTRIRPLPPLQDVRVQAGTLMSLIDIVTWVCALEPWMQSAWGAKLAERAVVQIQQAMAQILI
jgi:Ser/Thr protein kinase RdoA (MazF antagonist)